MKLVNAKANFKRSSNSSGIGIENVKRRLALLYADKHVLKITNAEEVFIVDLKLQIERRIIPVKPPESPQKALMYE
jgi:LytS/YehU family sensor histidine kinase